MATEQEVIDYVNALIVSQDLKAMCWSTPDTYIHIRIIGQYSDNQLNHLVNHFDEVTGYSVEGGAGWVDIVYGFTPS